MSVANMTVMQLVSIVAARFIMSLFCVGSGFLRVTVLVTVQGPGGGQGGTGARGRLGARRASSVTDPTLTHPPPLPEGS